MRPKHLVAILVLVALIVPASPAHAGGIVSVCDETHLRAALAGGGTVTFTCNDTIALAGELVIAANTTIDGGGQIARISGDYSGRVFTVDSAATLTLHRVSVKEGNVPDSLGGAINNNGKVIVDNSWFYNNNANIGGAINNNGTMTVSATTFSDNEAYLAGAIMNSGTLTVSNSIFTVNTALAGNSGDIRNAGMGAATVNNCTFDDSAAVIGTNWASINAGASPKIDRILSGNSLSDASGIYNIAGSLSVNNSTFHGRRIRNSGTANVYNSTFYNSGALFGAGIYNQGNGTVTVSNCTFSENFATAGAGIYNADRGSVMVVNSTFSDNEADSGAGIYNTGTVVTLKNTIVANSPRGGNCFGTIIDGGGNLSFPDGTCPGINANPQLLELQNNGGPTRTMALLPGSAAIDVANDATCAAAPVNNRDQRGFFRPWGPHCDIGAVEQGPHQITWLPVVRVR